MTRAEVIADARLRWLERTPYVHQARVAGVGADCIGLVGGIARDRGTPDGIAWEADREAHDYPRNVYAAKLVRTAAKYLDPIGAQAVTLADIVFMQFDGRAHFAIVSAVDPTPYIIHAWASAGRVVENRLDAKWRGRVIRAYRYRGIE